MSTRRLLILAACVGALLATPVSGAAAEIVIDAGALTPAVLTVESDESVEVREPESPRSQLPVCGGVSVGEVCLER